ncbi:hypothetical protein DEO72_LG7g1631 [Vigna unguiculata]|uniref:Uncharacterized protein n=1 Tax=Vigna unguiculata TaxID=3917 RepID=A0A4D6MHZ8_VIGUN|nr:hypothetical protein DEO72_LG7g1631 [Vigna unguiculata]
MSPSVGHCIRVCISFYCHHYAHIGLLLSNLASPSSSPCLAVITVVAFFADRSLPLNITSSPIFSNARFI